jgi:hypothetical protein
MKIVSGLVARGLTKSLIMITVLAGCAHSDRTESAGAVSGKGHAQCEQPAAALEQPPKVYPSLADIVLQRQQLCLIPNTDRLRMLDDYRSVFVEHTASPDILEATLSQAEHKLTGLLLASCNPARTPGVLSEMLAVVTEDDWPVEHMAFFDVVLSSHRAYVLLDNRHRAVQEENAKLRDQVDALKEEYEALRLEHEKTIKGISDIERGIDPPRDDLGL